MPRILFHFQRPSQLPVLTPVLDVLRDIDGVELAITITPINRRHLDGFDGQNRLQAEKIGLPILDDFTAWNPDAVIMAENYAHRFEGNGKLALVPERISSKGLSFTEHQAAERDNLLDLICAPGPIHKQKTEQSGKVFTSVIGTGFPKLDAVFKEGFAVQAKLKQYARISPKKKAILYAPTEVMPLSSVPILWTRIRQLANDQTHLFVKLHPRSPYSWTEDFRLLAGNDPNITLVREDDLASFLALADVVISDTSSAYLEAILLDKPVVLFENPNQREYPLYQSNDLEYMFQKAAFVTSSFEELNTAVQVYLADPEQHQEERAEARLQLHVDLDGNSAQRVADAILGLLDGIQDSIVSGKHDQADTAIILPVDHFDPENAERTLGTLKLAGAAFNLFVLPLNGHTHEWLDRLASYHPVLLNTPIDMEALQSYQYTCVLQQSVLGFNGWLTRLQNHLRMEKQLQAVVPQLAFGIPSQNPTFRLGTEISPGPQTEQLDHQLKVRIPNERVPLSVAPALSCILIRNIPQNMQIVVSSILEKGKQLPLQHVALAMDTLIEEASENAVYEAEWAYPLSPEQKQLAEERVIALADWIQMPLREQLPPDAPVFNRKGSNGKTAQPATDNGHVRLARHYINRNKRHEAEKQVRFGLEKDPDHPELIALARELGILTGREQ